MIGRVAAGVAVNLFDKLVVAGAQLLLVPILSGAWGLKVYGFWVLVATVPTFLAMGDFGFATAAGTKMTMAEARGDRAQVITTFQSAWLVVTISSALLIGLAVVTSLCAPRFLFEALENRGNEGGETLLFLLVYGIVALQSSVFFAGFRCAQMFAFGALVNAFVLLFENAMLIASVLMGAPPHLAAATLLAARCVGLLAQYLLLRFRLPWLAVSFEAARLAEVKVLLLPAAGVMLLPLAQALCLQGTALAVGASLGQASVPAFTASRTLSRVGLQVCWMVSAAVMPEASAAAARNDRRLLAILILATILASAVLIIPFAGLYAAFGHELILLWSRSVIDSPAPLQWAMACSILFSGFWFPLSNLIMAANRHASYTGIYAGLAALCVASAFALSKAMGVVGAGVAMAATDAAMLLVVYLLCGRTLVPIGEALRLAPDLPKIFRARWLSRAAQ